MSGKNQILVMPTGSSGGGGSSDGTIPSSHFVANYSALPPANTVPYEIWICENSQGTSWIHGSVGGTSSVIGMTFMNGYIEVDI